MTKKAHGGDHDQKLASKEKPKGKNCPRIPKPPNTAKAIADKAGHRAAGTHPRARGSTCLEVGAVSKQEAPLPRAREARRHGTGHPAGNYGFPKHRHRAPGIMPGTLE
jgi:hypothetical protein